MGLTLYPRAQAVEQCKQNIVVCLGLNNAKNAITIAFLFCVMVLMYTRARRYLFHWKNVVFVIICGISFIEVKNVGFISFGFCKTWI